MDKSIIKNFAIWARRRLIEQVSQNAIKYGVEKEEIIEEVAYTWFNRFVALYYMEVNGYLNASASFFTGSDGTFAPEIIEKVSSVEISGMSRDVVNKLIAKGDKEALYRYLIISQCNSLGDFLPEIFKKINGYTESLCPMNLLDEDSVLAAMVNNIDVNDWKDNVEIISWLYQFYNTEPKNNAFAMLKNNQKLTKERIPEATQLFTPEWIVAYMVENSLGRYWMEKKSDSSLIDEMPYFMHESKGLKFFYDEKADIRDIRFIDPCMGSGHILDYAFELLLKIYLKEGYTTGEAVRNILQYNLYGLDIDERACQLSYFSIMMKACTYDKTLLEEKIRPQFYAISDSSFIDDELISFVAGENKEFYDLLDDLRTYFENAGEFGSIIRLPKQNWQALIEHVQNMDTDYYEDLFSMMKYQLVQNRLLPLLKQAQILSSKYNIVVTNPPYMAISNMDKMLADYVKKEYKDSKKDMYAVFIERCATFAADEGYVALITQHTWMFINSYLKLRKKLYDDYHFLHMLHLGTRAFEEISGEVVQTTTWVMRAKSSYEINEDILQDTYFVKLTDFGGRDEKQKAYLNVLQDSENKDYLYSRSVSGLKKIPGMPLAYWVDEEFAKVYERLPLETYADATNGLFTCDNNKYLRQWYEVDYTTIAFDCESKEECIHSDAIWFPYNKAGGYRRWYGNQDYVVYFENFGEEIADFREHRGQSRSFPGADYYFRPSVSWSLVSPTKFSVRYYPKGFVFDIAGSGVFVKQESHTMPMLGILASDIVHTLMKISNPTINYQCGDVRALPFEPSLLENSELAALVEENVSLEKEDWDSFELSWNFKRHPMANGDCLKEAFEQWKFVTAARFNRVLENETKISRIVAEAYGQKTADVVFPKEDVSMYLADRKEDVKSFLSFAVGCMLGRYSLDVPGIIHGGGARREDMYISYKPKSYIVISSCGIPENEIISELEKILAVLFGKESIENNMIFLAESLSNKSVSEINETRKVLEKYFKTDFYKEHVKKYKKSPIYWLIQADKLQILTYMHNFGKETLSVINEEIFENYTENVTEDFKRVKADIEAYISAGTKCDYRLKACDNMAKWRKILK